jgi:putative hydrolase of the HAD superfamily
MNKNIEVIGFDADDTLWVNEDYYRGTEKKYARLLKDYGDEKFIMDELFQTEMKNLELYGYGVKPFIISMVENAIRISGGKVPVSIIGKVLEMGREMLLQPIELLPGVKEVIGALHGKYKLIVATKGDLLDQERKLRKSSLSEYFHHIEIMSDKTLDHYRELLKHLEIEPEQFVMIGNSLRSDILPPYELGCSAIYVPYRLTWQHEMNVEEIPEGDRFFKVDTLSDVLEIIQK